MANLLQYIVQITDRGTSVLRGITQQSDALGASTGRVNNTLSSIGANYLRFNQMREAIQSVSDALNTVSGPGMALQTNMAELEAITGVTGQALTDIQYKARSLAVTFGTEAANSSEMFTETLSRLGPELAKTPVALNGMVQNMLVLSKTMKGNTQGAMDALTTSMLQYNVSLANPIEAQKEMTTMMNIMAAGAVVGSAKVEQVSASLKVAGTAAYNSNVSFAETNAALQVLGKGGLYASEAGTGLRNVLNKLNEGRFLPKDARESLAAAGVDITKLSDKTIPFSERLKELQKVQSDTALITNLFGTENANAANILLANVGSLEQWTTQVQGTNAATDAAAIQMGTMAERLQRMKAYWQDWGISIFQTTQDILPFITLATQGITLYSQLGPVLTMVQGWYAGAATSIKAFSTSLWTSSLNAIRAGATYVMTSATGLASYISATIAATAAQYGLNIAMSLNTIGLIIAGLLAVGLAVYAIIDNWDVLTGWLMSIAEFFWNMNPFKWLIDGIFQLFPSLKDSLGQWWEYMKSWFDALFGWIGDLWDGLKKIVGFEGELKMSVSGTNPGDAFGVTDPATTGDLFPASWGGFMAPSGVVTPSVGGSSGGTTKGGNVSINLQNLVGTLTIHVADISELTGNLEDLVLETMSRALNKSQMNLQ